MASTATYTPIPTQYDIDHSNSHKKAFDNTSVDLGSGVTSLHGVLNSTKVTSIVPEQSQTITQVNTTDRLPGAFQNIVRKNLTGVPVYDPLKKDYVCFLTALDVVSYFSRLFTANDLYVENFDPLWDLALQTVQQTCDSEATEEFNWVTTGATLVDVLGRFVSQRVHTIAVFDDNRRLHSVISQFDVIRYLAQHLSVLGPLRFSTVGQLRLGTSDVLSIPSNHHALDAFKQMAAKRVSGIAVVDKEGQLVGNISASDLKAVADTDWLVRYLLADAGEFLRRTDHVTHIRPVTVRDSTPLGELLNIIVKNNIHHVYIVDYSGKKLRGVISLGDILAALQSQLRPSAAGAAE